MRMALFSDIHSNEHALEAVLADMAQRGIDQMVCLGDITMKGPLPKQCVDRVRALGCPVVLGNTDGCYHPDSHPTLFPPQNESQVAARQDFERHERALTADDRAWLTSFPLTYTTTVEGNRLDLFHAVPHHNYLLVMPWASNAELGALRLSDDTQISAFGHSHRPFIRYVEGRLVINTGSVGAPFDGDPRASYALLDFDHGTTCATLIRVPYDSEAAIKVAQDVGMSGWELFAHTARTGQFPG
jgi:putative phosphoesterase